jgi:Branched-chain amino acid ABC-type transport system, permease components
MAAFDPQLLWNGVVLGSLIALAALGLTLLFGLLNFINLAYGEYLAWGAYIALGAKWADVPFILAITLGAIGAGVIAVITDRVVFTQFSDRDPVVLLVVSIGVAFMLRNLIRVVYGGSTYFYEISGEAPVVLGIRVLPAQIVIVTLSVLILAVVFLILNKTRIGIAMRAASDDTDLARIRGINTKRLVIYVSLIGGVIAGIAGTMLGIDSNITPTMGFLFLIPIFAAVILGGIGDPVGAVVGGYALGIGQNLSIIFIPSEYTPAFALLILIIGLLTRPNGLFGEATR